MRIRVQDADDYDEYGELSHVRKGKTVKKMRARIGGSTQEKCKPDGFSETLVKEEDKGEDDDL